MATTDYAVTGMTCSHCERSITAEVSRLPGVTEVKVDIPAGRVSVAGDGVESSAVIGAIDEAGYQAQVA